MVRGLKTVGRWLWAHRSAALGVALVLVGIGGYLLGQRDLDPRLGGAPGIAPAEYLYLDNARVLAYLSQANFGLTDREERSITQTESLDAGIETAPFKAGGSAQSQSFVKQVVSPTATSNYFRLLGKLEDLPAPEELIKTSATELAPKKWDEIREGSFVKVTGVEFQLPAYATDYFFLQRSGSPRLRRVGSVERRFTLTGEQKAAIKKWLRRFGKNPRITFSFEIPREDGPVRVLLPAQYAALADEQSLITGGELTIVGKVVRKVDGDRDEFVDGQTLGSFANGLGRMPTFLIKLKRQAENEYIARVRKGSKSPDAPPEVRASRAERLKTAKELKRNGTTRDNLVKDLKDSTRLDRNGLVIIPVAIYK